MISTGLTRARRSQAALALDPIPAQKAKMAHIQFAEFDKHNSLAFAADAATCLQTVLDCRQYFHYSVVGGWRVIVAQIRTCKFANFIYF